MSLETHQRVGEVDERKSLCRMHRDCPACVMSLLGAPADVFASADECRMCSAGESKKTGGVRTRSLSRSVS